MKNLDHLNGSYIWSHHEETKTERKLKKALLKAKINFSQEVPVRSFTVDFLINDWLVVEVDGESHLTSERAKKDKSRQKAIEDMGFTVMRIPASDLSRPMGQDRWVKKIQDTLSKPRFGAKNGFSNVYYKEQVEKAKKALAQGEAREKRQESLAFDGKHTSEEETMESYFGEDGEDFAALLLQHDKMFVPKEADLPKKANKRRKNQHRIRRGS